MPAPASKRSHFSLGGIPVRVEPAFFIIIAILGYNPYRPSVPGVLWWVGIAFVSILVHELGHAVAFRLYGVRPSITLHGMGGLTSGSGELSPMHHIVVSLAGPLSALVLLGIPSWLLAQSGTITSIEGRDAVTAAVWINIGWSLLNLLPILPLDGGQVFAAGVEMATKGKADEAARVRLDRRRGGARRLRAVFRCGLRRADCRDVHRDQRVDVVACQARRSGHRFAGGPSLAARAPAGGRRAGRRRGAGQATFGRCVAVGERAAGLESAVAGRSAGRRAGRAALRPCRPTERVVPGRAGVGRGPHQRGRDAVGVGSRERAGGPGQESGGGGGGGIGTIARRGPGATPARCARARRVCGCSRNCSATPATTPTPRRSAARSARSSRPTGTSAGPGGVVVVVDDDVGGSVVVERGGLVVELVAAFAVVLVVLPVELGGALGLSCSGGSILPV